MQMRRKPFPNPSFPIANARSWSISPSRRFWMQIVHLPLRQS